VQADHVALSGPFTFLESSGGDAMTRHLGGRIILCKPVMDKMRR
jgi:hypothetical protein